MANGYEVRIGEPTKSKDGKRLMPFVMIFREEQAQESIHDLKPCPFCGKIPELKKMRNYGRNEWWVSCPGEYCIEQKHWYATRTGAIKAWNRRAKHE